MKIYLRKVGKFLVPDTPEDAEALDKYKQNEVLRADVVKPRNLRFFRKWWALVKFAFDVWSETMPQQEYKGIEVQPDIERFRKDVTILAGFFTPVYNARGEVRLEAESLKWGSMSEERFEKLYDATIKAILKHILKGYKRVDVEDVVNELVGFV